MQDAGVGVALSESGCGYLHHTHNSSVFPLHEYSSLLCDGAGVLFPGLVSLCVIPHPHEVMVYQSRSVVLLRVCGCGQWSCAVPACLSHVDHKCTHSGNQRHV